MCILQVNCKTSSLKALWITSTCDRSWLRSTKDQGIPISLCYFTNCSATVRHRSWSLIISTTLSFVRMVCTLNKFGDDQLYMMTSWDDRCIWHPYYYGATLICVRFSNSTQRFFKLGNVRLCTFSFKRNTPVDSHG